MITPFTWHAFPPRSLLHLTDSYSSLGAGVSRKPSLTTSHCPPPPGKHRCSLFLQHFPPPPTAVP